MKTYNKTDITPAMLIDAVATYNADAFCVETSEQAAMLAADIDAGTIQVIIPGAPDFGVWAARLDFDAAHSPRQIYLITDMGGAESGAFVLVGDNPYYDLEDFAPEFSELSHAGQCLDIYLHNTREIYERYTVPVIKTVVEAVRRNGWQLPKDEAIKKLTFWTSWQPGTKKALQAGARLVRKYDHLAPTAKDIEDVTRNYAAYIVESATFEIANA